MNMFYRSLRKRMQPIHLLYAFLLLVALTGGVCRFLLMKG